MATRMEHRREWMLVEDELALAIRLAMQMGMLSRRIEKMEVREESLRRNRQ